MLNYYHQNQETNLKINIIHSMYLHDNKQSLSNVAQNYVVPLEHR